MLQQFADLATKAFPNRWELYRLFGVLDTRPIEYPELQRRFEYAIKSSPSTQFVFFIDGLDEFQGDHADLVDYIRRLSEYSNTKLCVSSRPWNVFEDTFGSTPSLKVEDLTYPDLIRFVETSFTNSQGYAELRAENEAGAEALMHAVASKASGGFLWVGLVVKSLLAGLRDGEKLSRLYDRLDSLPPDLEDLFHKMLSQISDDDRKEASRLFQLVRAAREPLTVITLAWADEDDPKFAVDRAIEPLPAREKDAKSRRMRRRLKGYCRGLSETSITGDWAKATCYKQRYKDIIEVLLKHGTDPNFLINRFSPSGWEMVVSYKMPLDQETYMKFLRCGTDPEADLTYLREKGSKWQPVLELQKELQEKSPKSRKKTSYTS